MSRLIVFGAFFALGFLFVFPIAWALCKTAKDPEPAPEREKPNTVGVGFCSDCHTVVVLERDTLTTRCACSRRDLLGRAEALERIWDLPAYGERA